MHRRVGGPQRAWRLGWRPVLVALGVLCFVSDDARAQWGFGWGWGFSNYHVPSPTTYVWQSSLQSGAYAYSRRKENFSPYAGNSNAYFLNARDRGFTDHFDARSRRPVTERYVAPPPAYLTSAPRADASTAQTVAQAVAGAVYPLASFFNTMGQVVWPSDAPTGDGLGAKRDAADKAALGVLISYNQQGLAPIALVADARTKLVDYGRPALEVLRKTASPRVADSFHGFLMAFYDALGRAATTPKPEVAAAPG